MYVAGDGGAEHGVLLDEAEVLRHHCAAMSHQNHRKRREPQHIPVLAKVQVGG